MEAEIISSVLSATVAQLHISSYFLGIIVLALAGASADLFAAAEFAGQDGMGLVISICIGSAILALVVGAAARLELGAWGNP